MNHKKSRSKRRKENIQRKEARKCNIYIYIYACKGIEGKEGLEGMEDQYKNKK